MKTKPGAQTAEAIDAVRKFMLSVPSVMIAYSGGMDSSLLAILAQKFIPEKYQAVLVISEFMSAGEIAMARATASRFAINLQEIKIRVLADQTVAANCKERCYHCKKAIFSRLLQEAGNATLCEGSVTDDNNDYRPGKRALKELGVQSPLLQAGFSKKMVAEALALSGAADLVRPAQSCLATRIASNIPITQESLWQIEQGEKFLSSAGLTSVRLRHHGEVARIEVNPSERHKALDIVALLVEEIKALGFKHVSLDIDGYRKGSMNRI